MQMRRREEENVSSLYFFVQFVQIYQFYATKSLNISQSGKHIIGLIEFFETQQSLEVIVVSIDD